jgi:hypothetical protein
MEGRLPQNEIHGPNSTTAMALFVEFQRMFPACRFVTLIGLGRLFKSVIPGINSYQAGRYRERDSRGGPDYQRSTRHDFPDLKAARAAFESYIAHPVPWPEEPSNWQSDADDEIPV